MGDERRVIPRQPLTAEPIEGTGLWVVKPYPVAFDSAEFAVHFRPADHLERLEAAVAEVLSWHDPRGEPLEALRAAWELYAPDGWTPPPTGG